MNYKYFENVENNAAFSNNKCQFCASNVRCLEGIYFEQGREIKSVCLKCLEKKKASVNIPSYLIERLDEEIRKNCKHHEGVTDIVNEKITELKYTPPIPWIQYNDWQVCCSDFMKYLGEWEKKDFIDKLENGSGINAFETVLDDISKNKVEDMEILWNDIGENTVAFAFRCLKCNCIKVVCQSY